MRKFRIVGLGAGALLAATAVGGAIALQPDGRLGLCTQGDQQRIVHTSFAMSRAREYHQRIPRMGMSPELDTDDAAYVVAFDGTVNLPVVGAAPPVDAAGNFTGPSTLTQEADSGVVCVVVRGRPIFYANVDTTGMTPN